MKTRKLFALVLTAMMLLALTLPAFADEAYSITINNAASGHTYEAYQIFKGDLSEQDGKKVLSNVEWGSGVNGSTLLAALKEDSALKDDFTACESAADVAKVLERYTNDAEKTQAFAKLAGANLAATVAGTSGAQADGKYVISNLSAGYYLVKDKDGVSITGHDAYTRYILQVVGDVEVTAKVDVPTIDKKIVEGEKKVSVNEASIGDKIPYVVTSKVPDMTGYSKYFFVVNDTMSKGLTFNNDVAITVGGKALVEDTDFTVSATTNDEGVTTIKIVFIDFIQYKDQKGADIVINYSATLNDKAEIGVAGNENKVDLVYSNNPNADYKGKNEPGENDPVGKTPEVKTETYTTELTITKTDDKNNKLTGAAFRLTGNGVNVVIVTGEVYVADDEGTFWKLKDGTYTNVNPNGEGVDESKYESVDTTYKQETKVTVAKGEGTSVNVEGFVDADGKLTFTGLGAGEYTLTEIVTPIGYNTIDPITFTVSFDAETKKFSTNNNNVLVGETNTLSTTVVNKAGSTLPSTGGMGTTLFYVLGALLAVGAGVLLATRKKMSAESR